MELRKKVIIGIVAMIPFIAIAADYGKWVDGDKTLSDKTRQEVREYYEKSKQIREDFKISKQKNWDSLSADAKKVIEKRNNEKKAHKKKPRSSDKEAKN